MSNRRSCRPDEWCRSGLSGPVGSGPGGLQCPDAAKVEADAKATLAKFQADTKGADAVLANAKGVLVCPTITKGGFVFGYEGGTCVLT